MAEPNKAGEKRDFDIPSLDGIRAVSILTVFFAHAGLEDLFPGGFGVTIFFFLSGFLITTLLRMEFDRDQTISFSSFYTRRVFRILPPFYFVLIGATLLTFAGAMAGNIDFWPFMGQAFFLNNYLEFLQPGNGRAQGTGIFWSLAVEEHFYFLFPALYLFLRKRFDARKQAMVLGAICAAVLVWRMILILGMNVSEWRTYYSTDTRIDSILFGCIMAIAFNPMLDRKSTEFGVKQYGALFAGLGGLLLSLLVRNGDFRETLRYTLQGVSLFPIFFLAISHPRHPVFVVLQNKWVRWIGVLSYSIYLTHFVVLVVVAENTSWGKPLVGVVSFVVSVALAFAMHKLIEQPAVKLRKKYLASRKAAARPATTRVAASARS
ncbi:MAG: acyltransferase family protein [Acidimicrobiia bacterium]